MEDIIIPQEVAQILIALIIACMGVDIVRWFMREMGLDKDKKEEGKNRVSLPFVTKVRIFTSETLRYIGDGLNSLASRIMP